MTWGIVAPLVMAIIFLFYCFQWEPVKYGTVAYPNWAHVIGICRESNFHFFAFLCPSFLFFIFCLVWYLYKLSTKKRDLIYICRDSNTGAIKSRLCYLKNIFFRLLHVLFFNDVDPGLRHLLHGHLHRQPSRCKIKKRRKKEESMRRRNATSINVEA